MKTYKDYVVEATDERLEEIKAYLKSKKLDKLVSSVTVEGRNYYITMKHKDYTAKFLLDNDAYKKNSFYGNDFLMHRLASVTVSFSNKTIYNAVWHRYFTEIADYLSKANMIFDKIDKKLIGVNVKDIEKEIKKIDNTYTVNVSTKFKMTASGQTGSTVIQIHKPVADANGVWNPYFVIEMDCADGIVKGIKNKMFGFEGGRNEIPYADLRNTITAFNAFKDFINKLK